MKEMVPVCWRDRSASGFGLHFSPGTKQGLLPALTDGMEGTGAAKLPPQGQAFRTRIAATCRGHGLAGGNPSLNNPEGGIPDER